ncbi:MULTISPECIES: GNAT family N-acetyltransferase [Nocardiaceae]|uniref:RimJ/RimL family protein N-acetyltransferase n=1 Tax=Rhodococcoides corynebacterioides TaxID=53972 RepID=A0ABS2KXH2_9NOCA|nr:MULTISPECIES: GNAT family protein [Rhodococcus]MBM7416624.1 RimJ/RimL family protein N-acetyltransferase [Rhodococcus corynebacterioides]MBP1114877.1 RimJ/RimL family protein N-acetyltransferase [Rhodococcus sp. PvP016]
MSTPFDPGPLLGEHVHLEPLTPDHVGELAAAADDPAIFRWTGSVVSDDTTARAYIDAALADTSRRAFLQRDARTGIAVGTTSYYQIDASNRSVAIGYTWLSRSAQGTRINPESKFLLLEHAFGSADVVRVEWHTDALNEQSRAAIGKLGAQFEGLLRKHRRRVDGTWRTTALFSMTDDEWPAARDVLRTRIDG